MYEDFAKYYDRLMDNVDYVAWSRYIISLIEERLGPGEKNILDAACGTGNLSLPLAREGYKLTGADASEDMLRLASQKARDAGMQIPFIRQTMQKIALHRPVDAINCACDGVNYLLSDADLLAFFSASFTALKAGGLLLFDISSSYKLKEQLAGRCFGEDRDDIAYLWQNSYDSVSNILQMDLTFFIETEEGVFRRFRETHRQKAHEAEDLLSALKAAGFVDTQAFTAFTKDEIASDSERIQFLARKPFSFARNSTS